MFLCSKLVARVILLFARGRIIFLPLTRLGMQSKHQQTDLKLNYCTPISLVLPLAFSVVARLQCGNKIRNETQRDSLQLKKNIESLFIYSVLLYIFRLIYIYASLHAISLSIFQCSPWLASSHLRHIYLFNYLTSANLYRTISQTAKVITLLDYINTLILILIR